MAQRSPLNPRYQKHTKPEGKTRKSAASAKPKRAASEGSSSSSSSSSSSGSSSGSRAVQQLPPEVRPWRNVWWGLLLVGTACALAAFLIRNQPDKTLGTVLLVIAYGCIFGGLAIDYLKVRPARRAATGGGTAPSATSGAKSKKTKDESDE